MREAASPADNNTGSRKKKSYSAAQSRIFQREKRRRLEAEDALLPSSHSPHVKAEEQNETTLLQVLEAEGAYDTEIGQAKRQHVLHVLEEWLCEWSDSLLPGRKAALHKQKKRRLATTPPPTTPPTTTTHDRTSNSNVIGVEPPVTNMNESVDEETTTTKQREYRVALVSFGSYRLGVYTPDADIDALALSPPHVTRSDFFSSFVQRLRSRHPSSNTTEEDDEVTEILPIPTAYTPVLKFKLNGISIDLLFARLSDGTRLHVNHHSNKHNLLTNNRSLVQTNKSIIMTRQEFVILNGDFRGMDEVACRSLNGVRVTQLLLEIIPSLDSYRIVLRAVKHWARIHGLYGNVLGFLGGINWAILVALISKENPEALPAELLRLFFATFSKWKWPKPVHLTALAENPPNGVMILPVWNPKKNPRDGTHLMPIITPSYPSMNSSYNVGQSQMRRIQEEIRLAHEIFTAESQSLGTRKEASIWNALFEEHSFFTQHAHFLHICISATHARDFCAWFGMCEARLRLLINALENREKGLQAFPFAKFFSEPNKTSSDTNHTGRRASSFFIGLRFAIGMEHIDLSQCTNEFLSIMNSWEGRRVGMDLTIDPILQRNLPEFVGVFQTK